MTNVAFRKRSNKDRVRVYNFLKGRSKYRHEADIIRFFIENVPFEDNIPEPHKWLSEAELARFLSVAAANLDNCLEDMVEHKILLRKRITKKDEKKLYRAFKKKKKDFYAGYHYRLNESFLEILEGILSFLNKRDKHISDIKASLKKL